MKKLSVLFLLFAGSVQGMQLDQTIFIARKSDMPADLRDVFVQDCIRWDDASQRAADLAFLNGYRGDRAMMLKNAIDSGNIQAISDWKAPLPSYQKALALYTYIRTKAESLNNVAYITPAMFGERAVKQLVDHYYPSQK